MSTLESPTRLSVKPGVNVYTGMAALSFLATFVALGWVVWQYMQMAG